MRHVWGDVALAVILAVVMWAVVLVLALLWCGVVFHRNRAVAASVPAPAAVDETPGPVAVTQAGPPSGDPFVAAPVRLDRVEVGAAWVHRRCMEARRDGEPVCRACRGRLALATKAPVGFSRLVAEQQRPQGTEEPEDQC